MGSPDLQTSVWALAERQHGVVTRAQLLERGFSPKAIRHRVTRGRLHPVWEGVYAVGRPQLTEHGRWMAAGLSCGPSAMLSHESAAALWEIRPRWRGEIEVSIQADVERRRSGIVVHRRRTLTARDVTRHHGVPVTTPLATLIDIATRLAPSQLETAVNEADKRDLIDPEMLRSARRSTASRAPRPAHLHSHRLRARAPLPPDSASSRPYPAPDGMSGERLQGRLLLAGPGPGRGARRSALPPDRGATGEGSRARPGACRCGPHAAPLHACPGQVRTAPRADDPFRGCASPSCRSRSLAGGFGAPSSGEKSSAMFDVIKRTIREFREDNLTDWAAALTYYSVLSIFPGLAALVAILGLVGSQGTIDSLLQIIDDIGPSSAVDTFRGPVETVVNSESGAGLALLLSVALALWTASGYIGAFIRASNVIYGVEEGRPFWKLRPLQVAVALIMVLLLALVLVAIVLTGPLADAVGDV